MECNTVSDMQPLPSLFAAHLRQWCLAERGRSEGAFARVLGIDPSLLSRIKTLQIKTDTATLAAACVALGLTRAESAAIYEEAGHCLPPVMSAKATEIQEGV